MPSSSRIQPTHRQHSLDYIILIEAAFIFKNSQMLVTMEFAEFYKMCDIQWNDTLFLSH